MRFGGEDVGKVIFGEVSSGSILVRSRGMAIVHYRSSMEGTTVHYLYQPRLVELVEVRLFNLHRRSTAEYALFKGFPHALEYGEGVLLYAGIP